MGNGCSRTQSCKSFTSTISPAARSALLTGAPSPWHEGSYCCDSKRSRAAAFSFPQKNKKIIIKEKILQYFKSLTTSMPFRCLNDVIFLKLIFLSLFGYSVPTAAMQTEGRSARPTC